MLLHASAVCLIRCYAVFVLECQHPATMLLRRPEHVEICAEQRCIPESSANWHSTKPKEYPETRASFVLASACVA